MGRELVIQGLLLILLTFGLPAAAFSAAALQACLGFDPLLSIGDQGQVLPGSANNLRDQPTTAATRMGQIPIGAVFPGARWACLHGSATHDQDVGLAHEALQVAGEAMAAGGGAAGDQQLQRQRSPYMVGHTDDHRVLAAHRPIGMAQQGHHTLWRTRAQSETAQRQPPHVHRLEAIHVLGRIDPVDQRLLVDMWRQRRLHQDAVHGRIGIETVDQREQLVLGGGRRQVVVERAEADLVAGLALVAHVDRRGGIVPDQHHRQSRLYPALGLAVGHTPGDPLQQFLRDAFAVEDACAHDHALPVEPHIIAAQPATRTNCHHR